MEIILKFSTHPIYFKISLPIQLISKLQANPDCFTNLKPIQIILFPTNPTSNHFLFRYNFPLLLSSLLWLVIHMPKWGL